MLAGRASSLAHRICGSRCQIVVVRSCLQFHSTAKVLEALAGSGGIL